MAYNPKRKRGEYHEFSPEEIAREKKRFAREGKLVKMLPEQITPINNMVLPKDVRNYSAYELVGWVVGE